MSMTPSRLLGRVLLAFLSASLLSGQVATTRGDASLSSPDVPELPSTATGRTPPTSAAPPQLVGITGGGAVELGQTVSLGISFIVTGLVQTYQWQKNGVAIEGATNGGLRFEAVTAADGGSYTVIATNADGSSVASTDLTVKPPGPPVITTPPRAAAVQVGQSVTFSYVATGSFPRTHQWRRDGVAMAGATSATYAIAAVASTDAAAYSVVVSNSEGSATSSSASLIVNPATAPVVAPGSPGDVTTTLGQSATLFASVSAGSSPLAYQWFKDGVRIQGSSGSSLALANLAFADAGKYSFTVSNPAGSATSREATVTVNPAIPLTFGSQPQNQTLFQGQVLNLTYSLNGSSPMTYQWLKNGTAIPGSTRPIFTIASVALSDSGSYAVVATNPAGSVTSNAALVTVNPRVAPTITSQPANQSVPSNGTFSLNVVATGTPPLTYTWQKDGVALVVAGNSNRYAVNNATSAANGVYTVVVSNFEGSVTSNPATVTVAPSPLPVIYNQPIPQQVALGLPVDLTVSYAVSDSGAVAFQWFREGVAVAGATSSTYRIAFVRESDAGDYRVAVIGAGGTVTSSSAKLTVLPAEAPSVTSWPGALYPLAVGSQIELSVDSNREILAGTPPHTFQWAKNGVPIPGATNRRLVFSSIAIADYGTYTLTIANDGGVLTSPGTRLGPLLPRPNYSPPPAPPWLDVGRQGDVVYFLATRPARIERYDLAGERWLPSVLLSEAQVPTAFLPMPEGVYLAYGRALVRRTLDLATETPLANGPQNIVQLFVLGPLLHYNLAASNSPADPDVIKYGTLDRTTLRAGPTAVVGMPYGPASQIVSAPALGKAFGVFPYNGHREVQILFVAADGRVTQQKLSLYGSEMPAGSRVFLPPGERWVADDSGMVFRTDDLTYAGSLGEAFSDLAFFGDGTPVVLRGERLTTTRTDNFAETSRFSLPQTAFRLFTRGNNAFAFSAGGSGSNPYTATKVGAGEFRSTTAPLPAPTVPPRYSIDDAFLGDDNILHVFSRTLQAIVRWNPATRSLLSAVPLRDAPTKIYHQPGQRRAIALYPDGVVTEILLTSSPVERILFNLGHRVRTITDLGDMVSVSFDNAFDSGNQRMTMGAAGGPQFVPSSFPSFSAGDGILWWGPTRRLYSLDAFNRLLSETLSTSGVLDSSTPAVLNSEGFGISPPIRLSSDGTLLVSRNGHVFSSALVEVGLLANDVSDAAWLGRELFSIRGRDGQTELQRWAPTTYLLSGALKVRGTPVRLLRLSDTQLLVVSSDRGVLAVTTVNSDLTIAGEGERRAFAGVYVARLGGSGSDGDVALYLRADGTGTLLASVSSARLAFAATTVSINPDGTFVTTARDLSGGASRTIFGTVSARGSLVGSIPALSLNFTGDKSVGAIASGYYRATALNGVTGSVEVIVGGDGRSVFVAQSFSTVDGGSGQTDATGRLTTTTPTGIRFSLTTNPGTGGLSATSDNGAFANTTFAGLRDDVARTDRLANISTRGRAGAGEDVMIAGFVLSGSAPRPVLIRAIGPALGAFGVPGTLADPRLGLFRGEIKLSENDNWSAAANAADLVAATARVGGFPLSAGSADAALLVNLDPGAYTAQVSTATGSPSGQTLVEVYDAGTTSATSDPHLVNIATRGRIGAVGETFIAGIVVTGNVPKRLLVRAIGPGLAAFGVPGTLPDPVLTVVGSSPSPLATNDDWSSSAANAATASELAAAAVSVGAFALPAGSKDACLLLTLTPGNYTAQVTGKNNATGIALIEVYEVNN